MKWCNIEYWDISSSATKDENNIMMTKKKDEKNIISCGIIKEIFIYIYIYIYYMTYSK